MIERFCTYLTKRIQKEMPEVDSERAEIIQYGLQLIIGEIPKVLIMFIIAFLLNVGWLVLFSYIILLPYKISSGGFHCKTHIGCFLTTCVMYIGTALLANYINFELLNMKYVLIFFIYIFGILMITWYAPADTENVPIISLKERKKKKIMSYIFLTVNLVIAVFLPRQALSNVIIIGTGIQTCTITKLAYKITKNKYGYQSESLQ